jgi:hypothetical protein
MPNIDYSVARELLEEILALAESDLLSGSVPEIPTEVHDFCKITFESRTQAYRETLLGCAIARFQDRDIDIRKPYMNQGPKAFNGRTLDEQVVNPFLHDKRIPSSRGPYLGVFRRSVQFNQATRRGVRDKEGYDAFLSLISYLESIDSEATLRIFIRFLFLNFLKLREASQVPLSRLQRISLEQFDALLAGLLASPSGGRFPVLLVVATFQTIKDFFNLDWAISYQGINVADAAAGAGGDISISSVGRVLMAAEVTERPLDRSRVVATFNTKIAPAGIEDYLFFTKLSGIAPNAKQQANQYFSQGHEVNFLEIKDWIFSLLATMGRKGRTLYNQKLLQLLEQDDVPTTLKVTWNEQISNLTST